MSSNGTAIVNIDVIGGVRASVDGRPVKLRRQVQRLAAILVAAGPAGIEASALAEELWVGDPPVRWGSAVRNALTSLRSAVGPDLVRTDGGRYSLTCDVESVDAWRVLKAEALSGVRTNRVGTERFQPFNGLELTPLLQEMTDALHRARIRLVEQVTVADDVDPALLSGLIASVRADPFAAPMAVAVIDLLTRLDRAPDASQLLDYIEATYQAELGIEPPPTVVRTRQLAGGTVDPVPAVRPSPLPPALPSVVGDLVQRPMTQRHQVLAELAAGRIADANRSKRWSIIGLAGSGKSRFAAEVGHRLHKAGANVIFATAVGDEPSAYSPFLTASAAFRRDFLALATQNEPAIWALWSSIIEGHSVEGRPVALIVDDAHLLDRSSIRLLQFMHRMEPAVPITTIIVGRSSTHEHDWRPFEQELLDDDRTSAIDVPPFDVDDVMMLIAEQWAQVSDLVCRDAAIEIVTASGGLPMVAHLMIDSLSGPTLRLPHRRRSYHVDMATDRLKGFDSETQRILAAATLVTSPFSADDLRELLDLDPNEIDTKLDVAAREAVLSDMQEPGSYRFVHDLLRQGAVRLAPRTTRSQWGRSLMATTSDPLRLARLALVAEDLLDPEEVARLVTAGAQAALHRNLIRRGVQLSQLALDIGGPSDHEALACLLTGQVRLGAFDEATATRANLLDRTHTPAEHTRATRTLLDAIPHVKHDSSTGVQIADFDRLDAAGLSHDLKIERSVHLARLAMSEGDRQRGDSELSLARSLHRTDVEAAQLFYAEWACETHQIDHEWFEQLFELREPVGEHRIAEDLTQIESVELASLGRWGEAEQSTAALFHIAVNNSSVDRQWQSMLTLSGLAFAQGDVAAATQHADEALAFGLLYALPLAPAARAAQAFGTALYNGGISEWLSFVESAPPDLMRSALAMAAVGRARFEVGRVDEAWEVAEPILPEVLDGERRVAISVIAVLAPVIRKRAVPALLRHCIDLLRTAGDRWVITGAGIGVHGPATRSLAVLEGDRRGLQRVRHQLTNIPLWTAVLDEDIARIDRQ